MIYFMRSLEVHVFECEDDIGMAILSGTGLPEQLAFTACADCGDPIGSSGGNFEIFVLVIDENDHDWVLCSDCAGPVLNHVNEYFPPVVQSRFLDHDDDLEFF